MGRLRGSGLEVIVRRGLSESRILTLTVEFGTRSTRNFRLRCKINIDIEGVRNRILFVSLQTYVVT